MSRTPLIIDVDKVTIAVLLMIGRHAAKPCPSREELIECTALPRRRAWKFVWELQARGLIEIEMRGTGKGHQRRMRISSGAWTEWTQRRAPKRREALMADAAGVAGEE